MVNERDEALYQAAQMYYLQNETMEAIASTLGVSRSTVSRLLKAAREDGVVRISLAPHASRISRLAVELRRLFDVDVHMVPARRTHSDHQRLESVARVAARRLEEWVQPDFTIGVAWGTTLAAVVTHLQPQSIENVRVVQLNGAANSSTSGLPYASSIIVKVADTFDAKTVFFPVPAFFDYKATRDALWRERSIKRVLTVQQSCDIAVFGVGGLHGGATSHVYTSGYLDEGDMRQLEAQRVVGDICTVMLREDGTFRDIEMNARATGPSPDELKMIPRRVCIVSGAKKVPAALGALRAGVATDLIIDELTASAMIKRATGRVPR